MSGKWLKHGFWNTLEHAITRIADAATSLVLLWALAPELFARLAFAQALVAPTLFFFVSPETVIYRDYSRWKGEGMAALSARLQALRRFGWGKAQAALVLSALLAFIEASSGTTWLERFFALVWAYSLVLAPQIAGADREFLRMDLRLKQLNFVSLYQKLVLLGGTAAVALLLPGRIDGIAAVAAFSALSSAGIAFAMARAAIGPVPATRGLVPTTFETLADSLKTFTLWTHLSGVLNNWILTMDLFFLGFLGYPARTVGLYAAVLKLANFSMAAPLALSNLFSVALGRRAADDPSRKGERREMWRYTALLGAGTLVQAAVIALLAPWLIELLSHGRWSPAEQLEMREWLLWILGGGVIVGATFLLGTWLTLRGDVRALFFRVSVPWTVLAVAIYACAARNAGAQGAAIANPIVGACLFGLLCIQARRQLRN